MLGFLTQPRGDERLWPCFASAIRQRIRPAVDRACAPDKRLLRQRSVFPSRAPCSCQSSGARWFRLLERRNRFATISAFKSQPLPLKPGGNIHVRRPTDRRRLSTAGSAVLGTLAKQSISNRVFPPILDELAVRAKLAAMRIKSCRLHAFQRMSAIGHASVHRLHQTSYHG